MAVYQVVKTLSIIMTSWATVDRQLGRKRGDGHVEWEENQEPTVTERPRPPETRRVLIARDRRVRVKVGCYY